MIMIITAVSIATIEKFSLVVCYVEVVRSLCAIAKDYSALLLSSNLSSTVIFCASSLPVF